MKLYKAVINGHETLLRLNGDDPRVEFLEEYTEADAADEALQQIQAKVRRAPANKARGAASKAAAALSTEAHGGDITPVPAGTAGGSE